MNYISAEWKPMLITFFLFSQTAANYVLTLERLNSLRFNPMSKHSRTGCSPLVLNSYPDSLTHTNIAEEYSSRLRKGNVIPQLDEVKVLNHTSYWENLGIQTIDSAALNSVEKLLEIIGLDQQSMKSFGEEITIQPGNKKYRIGKLLGSSNCFVYQGKSSNDGAKLVAIKLDSQAEYLQQEAKMLTKIANLSGVANLILCGTVKVSKRSFLNKELPFENKLELHALVIELGGFSLQKLCNACGGRFSLPTILSVLPQLLSILEDIHGKGVRHKDIKPSNIVVNLPNYTNGTLSEKVNIIDFDLASDECTEQDDVKCDISQLTRYKHPYDGGEIDFMSVPCHNQFKFTRKDELWSIWYTSMLFSLGEFPWEGLDTLSEHHNMKFSKLRHAMTFSKSFGYNGFDKYLELLRPRNFFQETNLNGKISYTKFKEFLEKMRVKYLLVNKCGLDWNQGVHMFFDRDVINIGIGSTATETGCSTVFIGSKFYADILIKMNQLRKTFQALVILETLNESATTIAQTKFEKNLVSDATGSFPRTEVLAVVANPAELDMKILEQYVRPESNSIQALDPTFFYIGFGYYYDVHTKKYYIMIIFEQDRIFEEINVMFTSNVAINNGLVFIASACAKNLQSTFLWNIGFTFAKMIIPPTLSIQTGQQALHESLTMFTSDQIEAIQKNRKTFVGYAVEYDWKNFEWNVVYVFR